MPTKEQLPSMPRTPRPEGLAVGDEQFLWGLVFLEVAALFILRSAFRRQHGG